MIVGVDEGAGERGRSQSALVEDGEAVHESQSTHRSLLEFYEAISAVV